MKKPPELPGQKKDRFVTRYSREKERVFFFYATLGLCVLMLLQWYFR